MSARLRGGSGKRITDFPAQRSSPPRPSDLQSGLPSATDTADVPSRVSDNV
jgi:hypothetical protein